MQRHAAVYAEADEKTDGGTHCDTVCVVHGCVPLSSGISSSSTSLPLRSTVRGMGVESHHLSYSWRKNLEILTTINGFRCRQRLLKPRKAVSHLSLPRSVCTRVPKTRTASAATSSCDKRRYLAFSP